MIQLARALRDAVSQGGPLALPLALAGGVVTGLNPCCLPMYPAAAATCCAARGGTVRVTFRNALSFIAGMAVTTAILGLLAAVAGRVMTGLGGWPAYVIALVPIAMGLHLLGVIRLPFPTLRTVKGGLGGSFVAGLVLSLVIAPCGTPVLASLLSFAAYNQSPLYGAVLLLIYGLGAGLPVLLLATATGGLAQRLDSGGWRKWVDRVAATGMIAFGVYLIIKAASTFFASRPSA